MTRDEKARMLDDARDNMRNEYNAFWEHGNMDNLRNASYFASVVSALVADLG